MFIPKSTPRLEETSWPFTGHWSRCSGLWVSSRFYVRGFLPILCHLPLDPLEVKDKNRVEARHQQQGDEGSDSQSADLGIAERLPERAAFEGEWKQSKDRCAYCDHHRANAQRSLLCFHSPSKAARSG